MTQLTHAPWRTDDRDWTKWRKQHEAALLKDRELVVFIVTNVRPGFNRLDKGAPFVLVGSRLKMLDALKAQYRDSKTGSWVGEPLLRTTLTLLGNGLSQTYKVYEVSVATPLGINDPLCQGDYAVPDVLKGEWLSLSPEEEWTVPATFEREVPATWSCGRLVLDAHTVYEELSGVVSRQLARYYQASEDKALREWQTMRGTVARVAR